MSLEKHQKAVQLHEKLLKEQRLSYKIPLLLLLMIGLATLVRQFHDEMSFIYELAAFSGAALFLILYYWESRKKYIVVQKSVANALEGSKLEGKDPFLGSFFRSYVKSVNVFGFVLLGAFLDVLILAFLFFSLDKLLPSLDLSPVSRIRIYVTMGICCWIRFQPIAPLYRAKKALCEA